MCTWWPSAQTQYQIVTGGKLSQGANYFGVFFLSGPFCFGDFCPRRSYDWGAYGPVAFVWGLFAKGFWPRTVCAARGSRFIIYFASTKRSLVINTFTLTLAQLKYLFHWPLLIHMSTSRSSALKTSHWTLFSLLPATWSKACVYRIYFPHTARTLFLSFAPHSRVLHVGITSKAFNTFYHSYYPPRLLVPYYTHSSHSAHAL